MSRHYKTNSAELYHDIFKVCSDIIQEKGIEHYHDITLQATTKLEEKHSYNVMTYFSYVANKDVTWANFGDPQLQPRIAAHHLKIYK